MSCKLPSSSVGLLLEQLRIIIIHQTAPRTQKQKLVLKPMEICADAKSRDRCRFKEEDYRQQREEEESYEELLLLLPVLALLFLSRTVPLLLLFLFLLLPAVLLVHLIVEVEEEEEETKRPNVPERGSLFKAKKEGGKERSRRTAIEQNVDGYQKTRTDEVGTRRGGNGRGSLCSFRSRGKEEGEHLGDRGIS